MANKKKVYLALSGGVDSSVTALLLLKQDYNVTGVFMKNFDPSLFGPEFEEQCHWREDQEDAREVAAHLGIEFEIWNFEKEYYQDVIDYFFHEYQIGRTPNPDVMCNRYIKFGAFLKKALSDGADYVATGHYVRQVGDKIMRGTDTSKDQSYFLWTLTQDQLQHTLFPLGELTKTEVRGIAKQNNLPNATKPDSQGICFVGEIDIVELLKTKLPEKVGDVLTAQGEKLGEHQGAHFYTEGQRKGLGIGGGIPYFVAKKDVKQNVVTVAKGFNDKVLFSKELTATNVNWVSGYKPKLPLKCQAEIRYRQQAQECEVSKKGSDLHVTFSEPQRAITPGQSIVIYKNDELLGGGVIN